MANSVNTDFSKASMLTQKIVDKVSTQSESRLSKMQGFLNEEYFKEAWDGIGLYLSRQMRFGRAIKIPKFGTFTFTNPIINMEGVTNPSFHDKKPIEPIFIISKDFVNGMEIKAGISTEFGLRPISIKSVNQKIQYSNINFSEISFSSKIDVNTIKLAVSRLAKEITFQAKLNKPVLFDIPAVGVFHLRNRIAAVDFDIYFKGEVKSVLSKSLVERCNEKNSVLTEANLRAIDYSRKRNSTEEKPLDIDENAINYLKNSLDIDIPELFSSKKTNWRNRSLDKLPNRDDLHSSLLLSKPSGFLKLPINREYKAKSKYSSVKIFDREEELFQKYTEFLMTKGKTPEEHFIDLLRKVFNTSPNLRQKVNYQQFFSFTTNEFMEMTPKEIQQLFNYLDRNQDGLIDYDEYMSCFEGNIRTEINAISKILKNRNVQKSQILEILSAKDEYDKIQDNQFFDLIRLLKIKCDDNHLTKISQKLFEGNNSIPIFRLLSFFKIPIENPSENSKSSFYKITDLIKRVELIKKFEALDILNQGILDPANFKTVLVDSGLSISESNEAYKFGKGKKENGLINYYDFSKELYKGKAEFSKSEAIAILSKRIKEFLSRENLTPQDFLQKRLAEKKISIDKFISILRNVIPIEDIPKESLETIDINKDGIIDQIDLQTFLARANILSTQQNSKGSLLPSTHLTDDKLEKIIMNLKRAIREKKLSYFDAFHLLDENNDGFITFDEYSQNLDKIFKFSENIKEGLFNYFDNQGIGMVDYNRFLLILNTTITEVKNRQKITDNWDWHTDMMERIRSWITKNGYSLNTVFKLMDSDFDGYVSIEDLTKFLYEQIKILNDEAKQDKIERLYKLIDVHKRGKITINDISEVFGKVEPMEKLDWIKQCIHQIGLYVSQQYTSLEESYEFITGTSKRLIFKNFEEWITKNDILWGFNLTSKLVQKVFSELDPHKKGYLTLKDWGGAFSGINWIDEILKEVKDAIKNSFQKITSAFKYFLNLDQDKNSIKKSGFIKGINTLLKDRFQIADLERFWVFISSKHGENITIEKFNEIFGSQNFSSLNSTPMNSTPVLSNSTKLTKLNPRKQILTLRSSASPLTQRTLKNHSSTFSSNFHSSDNLQRFLNTGKEFGHILKRLKNRTVHNFETIQNLFSSIDKENKFYISPLQFSNILRSMNLGLSNQEVNTLIMMLPQKNGGVYYKGLLEKIKPEFLYF